MTSTQPTVLVAGLGVRLPVAGQPFAPTAATSAVAAARPRAAAAAAADAAAGVVRAARGPTGGAP